jgi:hypothetical protein
VTCAKHKVATVKPCSGCKAAALASYRKHNPAPFAPRPWTEDWETEGDICEAKYRGNLESREAYRRS